MKGAQKNYDDDLDDDYDDGYGAEEENDDDLLDECFSKITQLYDYSLETEDKLVHALRELNYNTNRLIEIAKTGKFGPFTRKKEKKKNSNQNPPPPPPKNEIRPPQEISPAPKLDEKPAEVEEIPIQTPIVQPVVFEASEFEEAVTVSAAQPYKLPEMWRPSEDLAANRIKLLIQHEKCGHHPFALADFFEKSKKCFTITYFGNLKDYLDIPSEPLAGEIYTIATNSHLLFFSSAPTFGEIALYKTKNTHIRSLKFKYHISKLEEIDDLDIFPHSPDAPFLFTPIFGSNSGIIDSGFLCVNDLVLNSSADEIPITEIAGKGTVGGIALPGSVISFPKEAKSQFLFDTEHVIGKFMKIQAKVNVTQPFAQDDKFSFQRIDCAIAAKIEKVIDLGGKNDVFEQLITFNLNLPVVAESKPEKRTGRFIITVEKGIIGSGSIVQLL